jgi:hypothetical protein
MRIVSFASILAASCLFGATAFAQQLGTCVEAEECDCSVENVNGYDSCATFEVGEIPNPSDAAAWRDLAKIDSTYDSSTNTFHVTVDLSDPRSNVIPIHNNGGQWSDMAELTNYLEDLLFSGPVPETPDPCEGRNIVVDVSGDFGRFDESAGTWAADQTSNFLWALISDGSGKLYLGDGTAQPATVFGQNASSACQNDADDAFSGRGCSAIFSRYTLESEQTDACDGSLPTNYSLVLAPFHAQGEIFNFGWNGVVGGLDAFNNGSDVIFRRRSVVADEASVMNSFYSSGGVLPFVSSDSRTRTSAVGQGRSDSDGVCTKGLAERGIRVLETRTTIGTAPSAECPVW